MKRKPNSRICVCRRCKRQKRHHSGGLCNTCYRYEQNCRWENFDECHTCHVGRGQQCVWTFCNGQINPYKTVSQRHKGRRVWRDNSGRSAGRQAEAY